jgi:hypothetical protein
MRGHIAGNAGVPIMVPYSPKSCAPLEQSQLEVLAISRYVVCKIDTEQASADVDYSDLAIS